MSLFAIADVHLGFGVSKPMSVFGPQWEQHEALLKTHWISCVSPDDTVVIPGDISWAMNLDEALPDFRYLDQLPGTKILLRGNHDYWWASLAKMETFCDQYGFNTFKFIRNNSIEINDQILVCGTRGWILPDDPDYTGQDEKIYRREVNRLRLSLDAAQEIRKPGQHLVACFHYPPFTRDGGSTRYTELLNRYEVNDCVFGHVHGVMPGSEILHPQEAIRYTLVAADYLTFSPKCIVCR